jgi:hypothetical protein
MLPRVFPYLKTIEIRKKSQANYRNVCLKKFFGGLADKLASFFEGRDFSATPPPPLFSIHFCIYSVGFYPV